MRKIILLLLALSSGLILTACGNHHNRAPVVEAWSQPGMGQGVYRVQPGDTLYSIAWEAGMDYRTLATINHLSSPMSLKAGQLLKMTAWVAARRNTDTPMRGLRLSSRNRGVTPRASEPVRISFVHTRKMNPSNPPVSRSYFAAKAQPPLRPSYSEVPVRHWIWPAQGRVTQRYSSVAFGHQGINIEGKVGQIVKACAAGEVVYSGAGIRGYGNLIIIKHNSSYLSAYAYNKQLLVRLGEHVKIGQSIATMGRDERGQSLLHFEIRRNGQPVDPLRFLS